MSALTAALRLSRRDARRFKGRSALIVVMIGLPVLVFTALFTGYRTLEVSPLEGLTTQLGAADARIFPVGSGATPIRQDSSGDIWELRSDPGPREPRPWTTDRLRASLPGARLLPLWSTEVEARLAGGYDRLRLLEGDLRDPIARGVRRLTQGRFAATQDEIAITPALADAGVRMGEVLKVTRWDRPRKVVGIAVDPNRPGEMEIIALPGSILKDESLAPSWLADTPAALQWDDVRRLNAVGLRVASRAVIEAPEPPRDSFLRNERLDREALLWIATIVILVVMETVLLAGPAFAVGLRRRRRELAMIAAQGGSAAHLRAIVLADGLVLGGAAVLLGVPLGIGGAWLAAPIIARWGTPLGPLDVPWGQVLGVAALGLVSGLVAAVVPAVQAARQSPAQVLAGREGEVGEIRASGGRPVLGLVLVLLGLGATAAGMFLSRGNTLPIVMASVMVVLGLVALMPWLVRFLGRLAPRLPLPARLSVRDAVRHRVRTASAAAAVMAATMAAVAMGVAAASENATSEARYRPHMPVGSTRVIATSPIDDAAWARVRDAVRLRLPGVDVAAGQRLRDAKGRDASAMIVNVAPGCPHECSIEEVMIGDTRLLAFQQGRRDDRAAAALAQGKAVVFDRTLLREGMLVVEVDGEGQDRRRLRIPAVTAQGADPRQRGAVVSPTVFTRAGYTTAEQELYVRYRPADWDQFERDISAVDRRTTSVTEFGRDRGVDPMTLAAFGLALVLGLGGTLAATGLAAADMRRDLDTLSAVGAARRTRRLVVTAQAGFVAGAGALVGLVGGLAVGVALAFPVVRTIGSDGESPTDSPVFAVPWLPVAAIVLGLPLLAALVAGVFTRTRWTPARRLA
ncbi:ABC transporter permease [Nonomuraea roseoviolacea]|uniref:ABC transport system permease protein n=1 Tax=Nonomuraea roseoviolacea subsp. carminata TaxID=160689 RepID=A0ABT1K5C9_9ACTN|nr:ABC transporter permease [Nonomuraea roseoviolacea]MCP2348819.1 putative ABC transport system permease protein [Nonomuraea roseoviolacea subsp. carminata]